MSDEMLFILIAVIDLFVMVCMWKMGRRWLELFIILNYIFANVFVQKLTIIFGLEASVGAVFYAAIFLGTDIITEHFGKKAGYQLIWRAFFAVLSFTIVQQGVLLLNYTESSAVASEAMDSLFSTVPRITAASLVVFIFVQRFDIWLYHWIHQKTKGAKLWLRNITSTLASQFLDTALFFTLAFYGVIPTNILINIMMVTFGIKIFIALADTPFIYLSYWIKGKKLSDTRHIPE